MKVFKFGGTSVGSAERMKAVATLINDGEKKVVVLSAMSKTTSSLYDIARKLYNSDKTEALFAIDELERTYIQHVNELYSTEEYRNKISHFIFEEFALIRSFADVDISSSEEKIIVAQGEILSTNMMALYLLEQRIPTVLVSALDFMRIGINGFPDTIYLHEKLSSIIDNNERLKNDTLIYLTQGFICRNSDGLIDNLTRGGSDYSASLIGAAIGAEEIQIWTDIDGLHNNDPRIVNNTTPIKNLHFEEASELAYFGAKILHPACILPARKAGIPVRLKNSMDPEAEGTLISDQKELIPIKAIAAKDGVTVIKVKSSRMLMAYGFLNKVFEVFNIYKTPIDIVCTSQVGVSMTLDDDSHLEKICQVLSKYGRVSIDKDMCIICIVGNMMWKQSGFEGKAISAMGDIPIRMVSYGGSNYNISIVIQDIDKERALKSLSEHLFIS